MLAFGSMKQIDPVWHYTEQARIAEALGHPQDAFTAWEKRAELKPLTTDEALHLAALWFGQGNAEQATHVLRQASPSTPYQATRFWRTYSDLAWGVQQVPEAVKAALILIRSGNGTEADFLRIQLTFQESDPELTYPIVSEAWHRFAQPAWWYAMVETGLRCNRARELAEFFAAMSPTERRPLLHDGRSWFYLSQMYRQNGDLESSVIAARNAIRYEPANMDLFSGYLWLLIDQKRTAELQTILREREMQIAATPELREPLAAAMIVIGEPAKALHYYSILARSRQRDPAWLTTCADLLEQTGYPDFAWQVRRHAQKLITGRIQSEAGVTVNSRQNLLLQAQLMTLLSPGDRLTRLIERIDAEGTDAGGRELLLAWAMSGGQTDLARLWFWRYFARATTRPEWARLGLAFDENDRSAIADLLETHHEQVSYRDAIEGARRVGMTATAETIAFEKFQVHDGDHLLDTQLRDLFQPQSSNLQYGIGVRDRGGVGLLEQQMLATFSLNRRVNFDLELDTTEFRHLKNGVVGIYPGSSQKGELGFGYRYTEGEAKISVGLSDGIYRHYSGKIRGNGRISSRVTVEAEIGIGLQADESLSLQMGGIKDEIALGVNYRLTERDNLKLQGATSQFMDQKRRYLGGGSRVAIESGHRLNSAWPDSTVRVFGGYHQYHANGTPVEKTAELIPHGFPGNAGYFIPASFAQFGSGIAIGQAWKETYSRNWKLFGAVDTLWNSVSGVGFMYEAGAAGPLLGLDTLLVSFSQEKGTLGSGDFSTRIDVKYRYLFN
jgi:tetratricopeptide (TPR) repeat protein